MTLTLSLFLFNLLPLPFLDGSQLLDALLDLILCARSPVSSRDDVAMRNMEAGSESTYKTSLASKHAKTRITKSFSIITGTSITLSIATGTLQWLRS